MLMTVVGYGQSFKSSSKNTWHGQYVIRNGSTFSLLVLVPGLRKEEHPEE